MIGIYIITNNINGKQYIGQSNNIKRRFMEHRCVKNDYPVSKAFKKYGRENFTFDILEECSIDEIDEKEIKWIKDLKPRYNISKGGKGNRSYHTEATKKILSEKSKQQWLNMSDEERRHRVKNNLIGGREFGRTISEEQKQKLRECNLGKKLSKETKLKIGKSNKVSMLGNKSGNKKVLCIELNKEFISIVEASKFIGNHPSCITHVLKGNRKTTGGYHWKYV